MLMATARRTNLTAGALCLALALLFGVLPCAATQVDPSELLATTIEALRTRVVEDHERVSNDPRYAMTLIEQLIAPHVDMRLASRLVLGKHWNEATDPQRDAFVRGLTQMLLRVFAGRLSDFGTAEVSFMPTEFKGRDSKRAIVRTVVSRPGFAEVTVDYRFYDSPQGWKLYDVGVFGISLIRTYHVTIDNQLREYGLDHVIEGINAQSSLPNAAALSQPTTAPPS
jgi:phospholipid transport system substrate-binding protein